MKYSLVGALTLLFLLSACGGGAASNAAPAPAPTNNGGTPEENKPPENKPDEGPKEDPDKWRNVTIPTPDGWHKASYGHEELTKAANGVFKKPGAFVRMGFFTDVEPPHASSGSDEEWDAWRDNVSAVFIYNVSKTEDSPVDTLKKHGGEFIDGFDSEQVREQSGMALYVHPNAQEKWAACVSNKNGTYVLVALVRNDAASDLMKPYPAKIKPE